MIPYLFNTFFYQPLYNGLVLLVSLIPYGDVGIAIIILTVIVKVVILPVTHRSVKSQAKLKNIEPYVKKIKEEHHNNRELQAKKIMELYKEHGVSPFSGCLLVLLQMPVILALYWVFVKGLDQPDSNLLYSFVHPPEVISMMFFGVVDLTQKNIILALCAGVSQYFQMRLTLPPTPKEESGSQKENAGKASFQNELAKSMNMQMRYFLPVFITIVAYSISAAVALYLVVSSLFSIGHELFVRRKSEGLIKN